MGRARGHQHIQARRPASQTANQSIRHPAIIWVHARTSFTPANALSAVPEITDTEEVTGSNPVSPTSISPSRGTVFDNGCSMAARYAPVSSRISTLADDFDMAGSQRTKPGLDLGLNHSREILNHWRNGKRCAQLCTPLSGFAAGAYDTYPLLALYCKSKLRSIS
jgi:hypothetical protein